MGGKWKVVCSGGGVYFEVCVLCSGGCCVVCRGCCVVWRCKRLLEVYYCIKVVSVSSSAATHTFYFLKCACLDKVFNSALVF